MKFVAVFLACIVAAQAATFACPSYDYWCSHSFHVLPSRHFYCYRIPFNRSWCTTHFYADCLVEYPKPTGMHPKMCESERSVDDLVNEVTAKLAAARQRIEDQLNGNLATFTKQIDEIHAQYIQTFTTYLKRAYGDNYPQLAARVIAYTAELNAAKSAAISQFRASVRSIMARIESFHAQLIARFRSCLTGRKARIEQFNLQLTQRINAIVSHYRARLTSIVNKKVEFVRCIYERLYEGKSKPVDFADFLTKFRTQLLDQLEIDVNTFQAQLGLYETQIRESYRCNSRCLFRTGCHGFSRKSFSRSCFRMPCAPRTSCKLIGVGPFKVDWHGCAFRSLRTCSVEEQTCKFDHDAHLKAITKKAVQHIDELAIKVASWKSQVEEWSRKATTSMCSHIECLMPRTFCGRSPTQAEIDAFRASCRTRAINWINAKKAALIAQIDALSARITAKIHSWEHCSHAFIMKIKAQFDACVAQKGSKIIAFISGLDARRVAQRSALVARLNALLTHHKAQFNRFYECAFGTKQPADGIVNKMRQDYFRCAEQKVSDVLAKFDAWWSKYRPLIIVHYKCGIKCSVRVRTPCLRLCYSWRFCAPSFRGFHFYC